MELRDHQPVALPSVSAKVLLRFPDDRPMTDVQLRYHTTPVAITSLQLTLDVERPRDGGEPTAYLRRTGGHAVAMKKDGTVGKADRTVPSWYSFEGDNDPVLDRVRAEYPEAYRLAVEALHATMRERTDLLGGLL